MGEILLFGGTVEGRTLAEFFDKNKIPTFVCVTTEYGEQLLPESKYIRTSAKALNELEMKALIDNNSFDMVIDATHPFAVVASENIRNVCEEMQIEYVRVLRSNDYKRDANCVWVKDYKGAVEYLSKMEGNIFITTGSKELKEFTKLNQYEKRCFVRVLPTVSVVKECNQLGFLDNHLLCMQGPFGKDINLAMLKQVGASYLVTKESGTSGGFEEKIEAALEAKVTPIVIGRPKEEKGYLIEEVITRLKKKYGIKQTRKVSLLGMGMGSKETITLEGLNALENCDAIVGSQRLLEQLKEFKKETYVAIKNEDIVDYIIKHKEKDHIVVAFSGDIGFYSGAKRLRPYLKDFKVEAISGISSSIYFLNRLGVPWEDVTFISLHGRSFDIVRELQNSNKIFALLGGDKNIPDICSELIQHGYSDVRISIGENLSYKGERIITGTAKELLYTTVSNMAVMYLEHDSHSLNGSKKVSYGMRDEEFIRDKTPMTKSEVRTISLSKLELRENSVIYDIGAGTGSVSIEAAILSRSGEVYAIEKKEEAVSLINQNKQKFGVNNLHIIHAEASDVIKELPKPTHAFIGGSSGNLACIIYDLLDKNPSIRIVLNVIALETLSEIISLVKQLPVKDVEIVQAMISKGKNVGDYNLMMGQNPVYIISFTGEGKDL
ncbi:bifunctional cobalt-precorrin-7 (C(5))-methyltransferase/cobalt-precorrin-6B (C(15))-methyltransferase [Clostridium sp. Marseille-P299]|uniref:bifunctional cobalt-precorrin-7 (C(5))-methyltransferase/cobalt-precorrin-6B (C(15))-methyltransferase n=1 Tax=Clostridium sp. Marseille-P299 TaxID=1805477 RepID=UPI00082F5FE1|nr:bifunctional cobalt-precorrin-7 (C(5))-methyltransferase/cobalt-precorrin-6B (C(15))-methyltransferase [Clostridium sp. Marseille-P299]